MGVPIWLVELKDWVQVLTPLCAALLVVFWRPVRNFCDNLFKEKIIEPDMKHDQQIQEINQKLDAISKQIVEAEHTYKAILHHLIFTDSKHAIERGYISSTELQNLDELYTAYIKLGGNGTAQRLYKDAQQLKLKE